MLGPRLADEYRAALHAVAKEAAKSIVKGAAPRTRWSSSYLRGTSAALGPGRCALVVGSARVEFGDDVSVATLRRVLEVLRS